MVRAVLAGAAGSVGAMAAHGASGGATPSMWALALLPVAAALFALLVRRAGDVAALGAASLLVQVAWHLLLMLTPAGSAPMVHGAHSMAGGHSGGHEGLGMLLAHLAVAVLTVLPCLGAERSLAILARLATAADEALTSAALMLPRAAVVAVPLALPSVTTPVGTTPTRLRTQWAVRRHPDRGPPAARSLLALAA